MLNKNVMKKEKFCMPDNVNSKEEHAQYLKDIGLHKHIEKTNKQIEEEIIGILHLNASTMYSKGSCGELGGESIVLDKDYFEDVAKSIRIMFDAITDPENQPNQYGIELIK
jgi:hypothetical protein